MSRAFFVSTQDQPHPARTRAILKTHPEIRGLVGRLALNVGYHNDHHDFPSVPWNRLPDIRRMASEFYGSLTPVASWSGLWLTFICNPDYSLYSRVLLPEPGS